MSEVELRSKASLDGGSTLCPRSCTSVSPKLSLVLDGKKFMWDGQVYSTQEESAANEQAYQRESFEVRVVAEDGKFLVYTRRAVQAVATG